jgi:hypothetical protein
VGEEPEGFTAEVAYGFALRDVLIRIHGVSCEVTPIEEP